MGVRGSTRHVHLDHLQKGSEGANNKEESDHLISSETTLEPVKAAQGDGTSSTCSSCETLPGAPSRPTSLLSETTPMTVSEKEDAMAPSRAVLDLWTRVQAVIVPWSIPEFCRVFDHHKFAETPRLTDVQERRYRTREHKRPDRLD